MTPALFLGIALAPKLDHRWFYLQTNLQVDANADRAIALMERAAKVGYNGVMLADTKIQIADLASDSYRRNVRRLRARADALRFEIVPTIFPVGYADAYGVIDPNLWEGMPVRGAKFVVRDGEAMPNDPTAIPNGGFESVRGDQVAGMAFQDGIGTFSHIDSSVAHGGARSLRFDSPTGNARICARVDLRPWNAYRMSVWLKSEGLRSHGEIRYFALGPKGKLLSSQSIAVRPTQDWTRVTVAFNSQEGGPTNLYVGSWGGFDGKLWIDDWKLENAGLLNVVRRATAPCVVRDADGRRLTEGKDYVRAEDPEFLRRKGAFDTDHPIPALPVKGLADGSTLTLDYHHAVATDFGKTALSLDDPAARARLEHELDSTLALFGSKDGVMFAHDEIRIAGWSEPSRNAGEAIADHLAWSRRTVQSKAPGTPMYVWSDMFDPYHNATTTYYLCNGSTAAAAKNFPRDVTVVNWNSGSKESTPYFATLGCRQILAGYYDSRPEAIADWLRSSSGRPGIVGVMYTTWLNRYDDLERFAKAAWGLGN